MKGVNGVGDGSTINVAIYGRVSTEHEEQMSAMENQCAWYESIAQNHSEWNIVERYYDKGITGTAMQKTTCIYENAERC